MIDAPNAPPSTLSRLTPQLIVGLLIIFVGVVFTLDELGIAPAINYLRYWPLALVLIGVLKMLQARDGGGAFAGLLFTLAGVWLQAEELGIIHVRIWQVWPLGLVLFGGYLVWQGLTRRDQRPASGSDVAIGASDALPGSWSVDPVPVPADTSARAAKPARPAEVAGRSTDATMSGVAILGGVSRGNNSRAFRGADLLAIMGGYELDLRQAAIHGDAVIDLFVMWGGIEIRVPEDWSVSSKIVPVMAGVDDKTRPPQGSREHRLELRGFALMGGVEIKN
jgi:predicted membrane protein